LSAIDVWRNFIASNRNALEKKQTDTTKLQKQVKLLIWSVSGILVVVIMISVFWFMGQEMAAEDFDKGSTEGQEGYQDSLAPVDFTPLDTASDLWTAQDLSFVPGAEKELVEYGRELIANTSQYLGPKGSVAQISNGMNCQNCHLQAGNQPYAINFGSVRSNYPKFRPHRPRGESAEDLFMRVSSCFERSLNGTSPAKGSKEMQAILAYINYVGSNVPKGQKAKGSGIYEVPFLSRAANPVRGQMIYAKKCVSCHLENGEGQLAGDGKSYQYPPLWGPHSFSSASELFRLSKFAGYVKANMPQGATYRGPLLSDEECWDLAAYVNSQPRPSKDLGKESPLLEEKLFDYPFGPYADGFSEKQHKYGPFKPIKEKSKL
jgi:thiosulfate dehydrogenase